jgi:hypothetical protein
MSKEAARIIKLVEVSKLPSIATKVTVNNLKEFTSCFEKIKAGCPGIVVMITAAVPITKKQKDKIMFVASYIPEEFQDKLVDWRTRSIEHAINDGVIVEHIVNDLTILQVTYPEESEFFPWKLIDVVNGTASSILKKAEICLEDSSSEEHFEF